MIWVGASEELPASQALLASLNLPPSAASRIHSYVGKTNFIELLGILKNAHSFVGVDSGPLHFADALGVPCVGIYGPTSTVSWGLLGNDSTCVRNPVPCSPCYQDDAYFPACPFHHKCMTELQPATVLEKLLPKIGDVAL